MNDLLAAAGAEAAGDREGAKALYRRVLAADPHRLEAHDALVRLTVGDDIAGAAGHALAAWRLDPADPGRRANLWQILTHMGEAGDVERFQGRDDCIGLIGSGNALRRAGQALRAERAYRRALERFPEVSFTLSRLGCLYAEQNRIEEADACFRQAAERHGGRDTVTRTAPEFLEGLKAAPPPAGITATAEVGPAATAAPLMVYVSCDPVYFRTFASSMLRSIAEDSGLDCAICLHVVNPDAETDAAMAELARRHGSERFVLVRERADLAPLGGFAKTYYACSRFLLLPELIRRWGKPVLMLDVDLMAIRDLRPLLAASARADLGMMSNALKRLDIWSLLYADVVHVNPTPRALRFLDLVHRYIRHFLDAGTPHWFLDQAALAGAYLAGFTGEPAPRFAWYPTDIHSTSVMVDADGRYWTDESAFFYSVRASAGGQRAVDRLKRRAGVIADIKAAGTGGTGG